MKVLVTGANGFLGCHIVKKLLESNYEVRAFILSGTSIECFNEYPIEIYEGNLLKTEDIKQAIESCDYLIHTAAITDVFPSRNQLSWKINYDVVKNIVDIVKESNIKRYVHVGTANSFGFGSLSNPGTETYAFTGDKYKLDYIDSKKAAQDLLLNEAKENKLPVLIINPTFMIGENDTKPGPGELIIPVIEGKNPFYSSGGRCFATVKDVSVACVNALNKGMIGECYITGGRNLCYKDFFTMISNISKVKAPKIKAPKFITLIVGAVSEFFGKIFKRKPLITRAIARISSHGHYYSSAKAINTLDYPQTDLEVALKEAINWYKENGYVKEKNKGREKTNICR